jgi:hypothetical protein
MNSVLRDILQRAGVEEGEKFASSGAEKTAAEKLASFRYGVNELAQGLEIDGEMAEKFASEAIGGRIAAMSLIETLSELEKSANFSNFMSNARSYANRAADAMGGAADGIRRQVNPTAMERFSDKAVGAGEAVSQAAGGAMDSVRGGYNRASAAVGAGYDRASGAAVAGYNKGVAGAHRVRQHSNSYADRIGGAADNLAYRASGGRVGRSADNVDAIPAARSRGRRAIGYGAMGTGAAAAGGGAYAGIQAIRNRNGGGE